MSSKGTIMKSVCIVGHGPSVVGMNYGNIIDSHDGVVRMVEWDWQNEIDYGRKYTIGVYSEGPTKDWVKKSKYKPEIYFYYDTTGKLVDIEDDKIPGNKAYGKIFTIQLKRTVWDWIDLVELQSAKHFSRGIAAVLGVLTYFSPEKITLVGFDAVRFGFSKKHHPVELTNQWKRRIPKGGNTHDWNVERKILQVVGNFTDIEIL